MVGFPHDVYGEGNLHVHVHVAVYCVYTLLIDMYIHATGSGIYGFVILKDGVTEPEEKVNDGLRNIVRTQIGGFAVPEILLVRNVCIHTCMSCIYVLFS